MTIGERLAAADNRPSGFDYMRIFLSFSVLWMHTARVSYGLDGFLWDGPLRPLLKSILPIFFALSGFLVAGSLGRSKSLISFLGNRVIRIYPALIVEVALSAFVLGSIFTTLPLSEYFSSHGFHIYLLNALGDIHFNLPGVFLRNPDPNIINAQLWTVPFELGCYLAIAVLFLLGVQRHRIIAPIGACAFIIISLCYRYYKHGDNFLVFPNVVPGIVLIGAFLFGVSLFLYRDRVTYSSRILALSVVFCFAVLTFTSVGDIFCAPAFAYITVYIGLCSPRRISLLRHADYSYGVYLYGFVIQQAIAATWAWSHVWYINGIIASLFASVFAACSWHFIEKPALALRHVVLKIESRYLIYKARF